MTTPRDESDGYLLAAGDEVAEALERANDKALDAVLEAGGAAGAFLSRPLATFALPFDQAAVRLWTGVFEVQLRCEVFDEAEPGEDDAPAVAALVGAIVAACGGALASVAGELTEVIREGWGDWAEQEDCAAVVLRGAYAPPSDRILVSREVDR